MIGLDKCFRNDAHQNVSQYYPVKLKFKKRSTNIHPKPTRQKTTYFYFELERNIYILDEGI